MRLTIEAFGEVQFDRELMRYRDRANDMKPVFREIADDFRDNEQKQFLSQGRYASGGWAPLAASTLRYKAARGLDMRILHATLRLRKSLTNKTHPDHYERVTHDTLEVGSSVPYGAYHQYGNEPRMPRRRPVEFPEARKRKWVKMLQAYLVGSR